MLPLAIRQPERRHLLPRLVLVSEDVQHGDE
jgi:hypothetical protein